LKLMILISFDSVENVCLLSCIKVPKSTKPAKAFCTPLKIKIISFNFLQCTA